MIPAVATPKPSKCHTCYSPPVAVRAGGLAATKGAAYDIVVEFDNHDRN
eukprot:gene2431-16478_t